MLYPLKKPLSYKEQIENLKVKHALVIKNDENAEQILATVNYYRLSAYGIGLKTKQNPEMYIPGITLEHIYRLYCFDAQIRTLLIPMIEHLEIELRTKIAYHLAMTYGAEGFRNPQYFKAIHNRNGESIHQKTIAKFDTEVGKQRNLPCVRHHQEKYCGHFPIWAAVELFTFGMLSSLFSVMQPEDQKIIAAAFQTDPHHLNSWLLSLVEIRNICAHYGRVYNMPLKQTPNLYSEHKAYQSNRLFSVLLVIKRMTGARGMWVGFLTKLKILLEEYTEVKLGFIGFPENWEDVLNAPESHRSHTGR